MPEVTRTQDQKPRTRNLYVWLLLILIVAFYFFGLSIPLVGPDEPRYAQVAREMFERGDWITPTLGGFNWFEKPALLYWLEIASYHLFGVNEFAARFGSALFGLGTVASLWLLGKHMSEPPAVADGLTQPRNNTFANWLALIAATSIGIIVFSRGASFDIILTFPITAAMTAFYIYESMRSGIKPSSATGGTDRSTIALALFYFFVGASLLAKGLIGIVFPYAIVAFYYLLSWRFPSKKLIFSLFWGTLVAVAIASIWYLPMYLTHGWTFIDDFFIQHHFQRYTSNKYFHPQPFYFFLWVLPLMTLPWLPFFFAGLWNFVRNYVRDKKALIDNTGVSPSPLLPHSSAPLLLFSIAWLLVPLVFFSFSGSKLPGYILPALPPALIFAAYSVYRFVNKGGWRKTAALTTAFSMPIVIALALVFVAPRFIRDDTVKYLIETADRAGYRYAKVITMYHLSHNAEFYAAGRLHRNEEGKQKLLNATEVFEQIRKGDGKPVLVIIPLEFLKHITEAPTLKSEVLDTNAESAIVAVSAVQPSAARRNRSINAFPIPISSTVSQ